MSVGIAVSTFLAILVVLWILSARFRPDTSPARFFEKLTSIPSPVWMMLGATAFMAPVFGYWISGASHYNGLAGFLPWADATEYFQCVQTYLLGIDGPPHCAKRPYYFAFFADLLWLTGNRMQPSLLLQALLLGASAVLFTREIARDLGGAAALGAYAALFLFAATLCAGLIMTENAGFLFGTLGLALLWRSARAASLSLFACGMALLAAGLSARPGPFFVLPVLIAWYFFYTDGNLRSRLLGSGLGAIAAALAMALAALPVVVVGGELGSTHSNFSYALYGLAAGGKSWVQAGLDHPEIYQLGGGKAQTDRVYELAVDSILSKPHLFILGCLKAVAHYFDDLFRYATEFKPLRLGFFVPLWVLGLWHAATRWRERQPALLLALQAGLVLSAPFIAIDGQNRVYAATAGVEAAFVALGVVWLTSKISSAAMPAQGRIKLGGSDSGIPVIASVVALLLPIALLALVRTSPPTGTYSPPDCKSGTTSVVVMPGSSTLVLPLVNPEKTSLFPLHVDAKKFATGMPKWVHKKDELIVPAGTSFFWGVRLDTSEPGQRIYFKWSGILPQIGEPAGFCIEQAPRQHVGTATSMHRVR